MDRPGFDVKLELEGWELFFADLRLHDAAQAPLGGLLATASAIFSPIMGTAATSLVRSCWVPHCPVWELKTSPPAKKRVGGRPEV